MRHVDMDKILMTLDVSLPSDPERRKNRNADILEVHEFGGPGYAKVEGQSEKMSGELLPGYNVVSIDAPIPGRDRDWSPPSRPDHREGGEELAERFRGMRGIKVKGELAAARAFIFGEEDVGRNESGRGSRGDFPALRGGGMKGGTAHARIIRGVFEAETLPIAVYQGRGQRNPSPP